MTKDHLLFNKANSVRVLAHLLLFGFAYAILLSVFVFVWSKYPQFLYMYRDGEYNLWISLKTAEWAAPYSMTAINPLQGMTSTLVTINSHYNPGEWVFFSNLPQDIKILISYVIYVLEVLLTTFALSMTLGFSRLYSFVASVWAILLLFPPFNFFFGLGGWFSVAPMFSHTLAMSNLCLIACLKLGNTHYQTKFVMFRNNFLLIGIMVLVLITILMAAPYYNAGMLLGTALLLICISFCSDTRNQFYWRLFAGFVIIVIFSALGLPEFYINAKAYSARFSESWSSATINWQNIASLINQKVLDNAWSMFCSLGVHCPANPGWPISLSTVWVNCAIILGGLTAWLTMPRLAARIGIFIAIAWITLLLVSAILGLASALFGLGIFTSVISPSWFYLMAYSLCAIYSLQIPAMPIKIIINHSRLTFTSVQVSMFALIISIILSAWLYFSFRSMPTQLLLKQQTKNYQPSVMFEDRHTATPITQLLKQEISLHPGMQFRGIVATIYGTPEGTLRKIPSVSHTTKVAPNQHEEFFVAASQSGSSHDLLDFLIWNIPTLSEYGQGLSRPFMYYIAKFLVSPGDAVEFNFGIPHFANLDVLRTMGVRFVVTDAALSSQGVTLRRQIPVGKFATIFLYELSDPNLGNYSPIRLVALNDVTEFYRKIHSKPQLLKTEAYVDVLPAIKLTPAYNAKMIYEKGGIHVTAKSHGTSALLLPIQFSHCYKIVGPSSETVKVMRANLIHTLVVFKKEIDVTLIWQYRWGQSKCRRQDVMDTKRLIW